MYCCVPESRSAEVLLVLYQGLCSDDTLQSLTPDAVVIFRITSANLC